jgi:hypothetical protein
MNKNVISFWFNKMPNKFSGFVAGETHIHFCDVLGHSLTWALSELKYCIQGFPAMLIFAETGLERLDFEAGDIALVGDDKYIFDTHFYRWMKI